MICLKKFLYVFKKELINFLVSEFQLDFPEIHEEERFVEHYERVIETNRFPSDLLFRDPYMKIKKDVIVYHIPYLGDINLLRYRGKTWSTTDGVEVRIDTSQKTIYFEYIDFYNDPIKINGEYEKSLRYLKSSYESLKTEILEFNSNLKSHIKDRFNKRKSHILEREKLLSSLGVPIKKRNKLSETFSIPSPMLRKKILVKPDVSDKGFKPEPSLDNETYIEILKIINDVGKNFERMPSTYKNKRKEDLRDFIIMNLDPSFEFGSAS